MAASARPPSSAMLPPRPRRRPRPAPYLPPFRQHRMDAARGPASVNDTAAQMTNWTLMKKHINGIVNRINHHNVARCALDIFRINVVRSRGVLCKALLRAQLASPSLSPVFASLIAVVASRMPFIAELLIHRLIAQLNAAYENQDRTLCFATARFIAHLFNHQMVNELLLLEFLSTCIVDPSDGSVELAVITLNDCAALLTEKCPKAVEHIFDRILELLHDGNLGRRAQVMIENLLQLRRAKSSSSDILQPGLDLLNDDDIITFLVSLEEEDTFDLQYHLDEYQFDPEYEANEAEYEKIKREILGATTPANSIGTFGMEKESLRGTKRAEENNQNANGDGEKPDVVLKDMTETERVDFRRTIYLTFSSGISHEEWAHKLLRLMSRNKGKEPELCRMIVECCSQEKTFVRSYGLLGQRFCLLNKVYVLNFEELFATHYATIHRFDTGKIRNISSFFAMLFALDVLPWTLFRVVRIVEEETTALSRIFLMILFQEICRSLGESAARERFKRADAEGHLVGVFPTDSAENCRFSIRFFTSIELKYVTDGLREKLKDIVSRESEQITPDGDNSSSSSSLSSSSLSSSSEGSISEDEHPAGKFAPDGEEPISKGLNGTSRHPDDDEVKAIEMKTRESARERRRDGVNDNAKTSLQAAAQLTPSHDNHPYPAIEKSHRAFVSERRSSGGKRGSFHERTDSEDERTNARKRRRYDSSDARNSYRREEDEPHRQSPSHDSSDSFSEDARERRYGDRPRYRHGRRGRKRSDRRGNRERRDRGYSSSSHSSGKDDRDRFSRSPVDGRRGYGGRRYADDTNSDSSPSRNRRRDYGRDDSSSDMSGERRYLRSERESRRRSYSYRSHKKRSRSPSRRHFEESYYSANHAGNERQGRPRGYSPPSVRGSSPNRRRRED